MKILARNLSRNTTEAALQTAFEAYGTVQYTSLVLDQKTGLSKGFAFIDMPKTGEAKAAMKQLNGSLLDNSKIRVKKAETVTVADKAPPEK
jgi:RNA recognition motif-containing protein